MVYQSSHQFPKRTGHNWRVFSPQKCWIMLDILGTTSISIHSISRFLPQRLQWVNRQGISFFGVGHDGQLQSTSKGDVSRVVNSRVVTSRHESSRVTRLGKRCSPTLEFPSIFGRSSPDFHWFPQISTGLDHWTNSFSERRVTPGFFQLLQGHFHVVLLRGPSSDGQELRQRGTQIPVRRLEAPIPTQSIQSKIAKIPQKSIQKSIQNAMEKNKHKSRTQFQHSSFVSIQNPSKVVNTISTLQFTIWPPFDHPIQSTSHLWKRHISRGSSGIHQLCRKILWIL